LNFLFSWNLISIKIRLKQNSLKIDSLLLMSRWSDYRIIFFNKCYGNETNIFWTYVPLFESKNFSCNCNSVPTLKKSLSTTKVFELSCKKSVSSYSEYNFLFKCRQRYHKLEKHTMTLTLIAGFVIRCIAYCWTRES
jgi:hypothetical protein